MTDTAETVRDERQELCGGRSAPPEGAAARADLRVGRVVLRPTAEAWAGLTPELRAWAVAPQSGTVRAYAEVASDKGPLSLDVSGPPTWETWLEAARGRHVESVAREERRRLDAEVAARREAEREKLLARDAADEAAKLTALSLVDLGRAHSVWLRYRNSTTYGDRMAWSHESVLPLLPAADEAWAREERRLDEEAKAKAKAEADAKAQAEALVEEQLRAYALAAGGSLARCVADGYGFRGALAAHLTGRLLSLGDDVIKVGSAREQAQTFEVRESPNDDAFALLDRATAAVEAMSTDGGPPIPACCRVWVDDIQRVTVTDEDGDPDMVFTAVPVWVEVPGAADRYLLVGPK